MEIFLAILWVALWAGTCAIVAGAARGRSPFGWAILGALVSMFALIVLLALPKRETRVKGCPRCAELVKDKALVCRFCGHEFAVATE
ncbi:MAG: zinc ribbon domain-containing protein [Magnetospirillum sp. WYHS-4]